MYLANHWQKPTVRLAYMKLHCPMILTISLSLWQMEKEEYLIHKKDFKSLSMVN